MYEYEAAGKGLRIMYLGEIAALVFLLVRFIFPLAGLIGILISGIVALEGLNRAGYAHDNYHAALTLIILRGVFGAVNYVAADSPVAAVLAVINSFLSSLAAYYICATCGALLAARGEEKLPRWANMLWKLTACCHAVDILCALVFWSRATAPFMGVIAASIFAGSVALLLMRLVFYHKTCQILLG